MRFFIAKLLLVILAFAAGQYSFSCPNQTELSQEKRVIKDVSGDLELIVTSPSVSEEGINRISGFSFRVNPEVLKLQFHGLLDTLLVSHFLSYLINQFDSNLVKFFPSLFLLYRSIRI